MNKKGNTSIVKIILCSLQMQFSITPFHTTFLLIIILLEALGLTARAITTQHIFDAIVAAAVGNKQFRECLILVLIMGAVTVTQQFINGVKFLYWPAIIDKTGSKIRKKLLSKVQKVDQKVFENVEFLDDLNKAQQGVEPVTSVSIYILNIIFFDVVYAVSMGGYLITLNPILIVTLALAFIPALCSQYIRMKLFSKLENESAPLRRQNDYYRQVIGDREYFKETRILGAFHYFNKLFQETLSLLIKKQWKNECKTTVLQLILNLIIFSGMGVSTYLLFKSTMSGVISVGAFAAVYTTLGQIFNIMDSMMTWDIGGIGRNIGNVCNFFRIMDYPERTGSFGEHDFSKGICANNVSFSYPGRHEPAVDDVSLMIEDGESIAIVGENGSGKSTLVRLLIGLYCPDQGDVVIGGLDSKKTEPTCLFKDISGVFQSFQKYKMTLFENVVISDIEKESDTSEVENNLQQASVNCMRDKVSLNTMLSPEFGGEDLSGGQWQRLAIARGLYRTSKFIVLDEPTAAIDPVEEDKLFTQFKTLVQGKSAIVVTHRIGSAKLANKIVVMDKGQIVDIGIHDELISRPGKYLEMWSTQAKWYERTVHNKYANA